MKKLWQNLFLIRKRRIKNVKGFNTKGETTKLGALL